MPIENQRRVAALLAALACAWLLSGPIDRAVASDETQTADPFRPRRRILLYYGNKLVDLRGDEGRSDATGDAQSVPGAPSAEDRAEFELPRPTQEHFGEAAAFETTMRRLPAAQPGFYDKRDDFDGPLRNVLRSSTERDGYQAEREPISSLGDRALPTAKGLPDLSVPWHDNAGPESPGVAASSPAAQPTSLSPTFDTAAARVSDGTMVQQSTGLEQRLTLLASGLVGALVCLSFVVVQLLIATRKTAEKLPPTIRLEMPALTLTDSWHPPRPVPDETDTSAASTTRRDGAAVDLAEQPVPAALFAGAYQQQRQQEEEEKKRQEEAMLTEIFNENLVMRQRMQAQPA